MHSSVQIFLYPLLFVRNGEPDKRKLKMLQMTTIKRFVQIFLNTFTSCLLQLLFTGIVIQGSIILTFKAKCNTQINFCRTRSIRWKWVCWNFLQVVGVLFYLYFIFVRFCVPVRNVYIFFLPLFIQKICVQLLTGFPSNRPWTYVRQSTSAGSFWLYVAWNVSLVVRIFLSPSCLA